MPNHPNNSNHQSNPPLSIKDLENESWNVFEQSMGIGEDGTAADYLLPSPVPGQEPNINGSSSSHSNSFGIPVQDELVILTCNHCNKPVLQSAFTSHLDACPALVQEKKTPIKSLKIRKKRKNDSASPKVKPSKLEKEAKKKVLNLDTQCGVKTDQGTICMRAITCKIHSVSIKRAVEGRTRPYDILAHEYQVKSIISRGGKVDIKEPRIPKPGRSGTSSSKSKSGGGANASDKDLDNLSQEAEVLELMKVLQTFRPAPLVVPESYNSLELWRAYKSRMALMDVFGTVS